jgi:hypothetical protein
MSEGTWFDNLTRALAGGGRATGRRGFLRLLLGGAAGATLGLLAPHESEATPADQATCSPRPRVVVTNTPTPSGLSVSVAATGSGNALQRITFGALRNGLIDVAGVVTGAGSSYSFAPPAGTTQTSFTVRAVDASQVVQIPFTVTDGCGDWRTFVGAGAGALQNPAVVCTSGETVLTADAPIGTTALQVSNQGCFKVGERIGLDPDGPNEELLEVVGFGSVLTKTPVQKAHPAGTRARRYPGFDPDFCINNADCAGQGGTCCKPSTPTGRCCSAAQCCPDGCAESSDPNACCLLSRACPSSAPEGSQCCDFLDGSGFKCHPPSDFQTSIGHCGSCGNDCRAVTNSGDNCSGGVCKCGSGPACSLGDECIRGVCCRAPNKACGPSTNRQCCNAQVAYCTTSAAAPGGICCNNNRWACGTACCAVGSRCLSPGTSLCVSCGCGANNTDGKNQKCLCGSGPPCDASQGLECHGGVCACAADPGFKLAFFSCDFNSGTNAYDRIIYQCDNGFARICKKVDPSLPAELPPYSCSTGSCNPGYVEIDPICSS